MKTRRFGTSDLQVSEICFGPMRFSARKPADDERSRTGQRALARALERGVNFIHSSYEYRTRWAVGQVLKGHPQRHDLHHVIKVPVPDFDDGGKFDATRFRTQVEDALGELYTERIAVVQHLQRARPNDDANRIPDMASVHEPLVEVFEKLREEGKVGVLTSFPYTPGFAEAALESGAFQGLVGYFNPIEVELAELFPRLEASGLGFLCIRPFMGGLLTDARVERDRLPEGDRFLESTWDGAYTRLQVLREALGDVGSWTDFCVRFCLASPVVASLIVGLNSEAQVDAVLNAAEGSEALAPALEKALAVYRRSGPVELEQVWGVRPPAQSPS